MRRFVALAEIDLRTIEADHGGKGPIEFRRLLTERDFATTIDFVDFTVIPPGSVIGLHEHTGNEEIYFVAAGRPRVQIAGEERRLERGSIAVVHSGQSHQLINDGDEYVEILVIQVQHSQAAAGMPNVG